MNLYRLLVQIDRDIQTFSSIQYLPTLLSISKSGPDRPTVAT